MRRFKGGRVVVASIAVLALASGLAACGGDDDDDERVDVGRRAGCVRPNRLDTDLCETNIELNAALGALFEAEDPEAVKAAYDEVGRRRTCSTTFETNAPDEIAADVAAEAADAIRAVGESGDIAALEELRRRRRSTSTSSRTATYVTADVSGEGLLVRGHRRASYDGRVPRASSSRTREPRTTRSSSSARTTV